MGKKIMNWKTKGMNRDMSVSAFSPEFSFENVNLRLATNEGNTMLSWVNEKGTKEITLDKNIEGTVIGTAIINHKLILFSSDSKDRIYKLEYNNTDKTSMSVTILYEGNLNFDVKYPIETLVSCEADYIQKVYWTDGKNQPRMINIEATNIQRSKWIDTSFDFVPSFTGGKISVSSTQASGGTFAPGVIQYCFAYFNKHGQQTNIVDCSFLYYITNNDRGASPEEIVSNAYKIEFTDVDTNFEYIRLYAIQRTSLNDTPIVKILTDMPIGEGMFYIDNGTTGSIIDPTELLFVGGKEIKALTMMDKDNTLFIGNITQPDVTLNKIQTYINNNKPTISFEINESIKKIELGTNHNTYFYKNNLQKGQRNLTTFKGGETYRFGFQLQKKNGEWLNPIYIDDITNTIYPEGSIASTYINLPYATCNISINNIAQQYGSNFYSEFSNIRPLIVYPDISDRNVLCQGVLNPTVFNIEDRIDGTPYAQASWFFRPFHKEEALDNTNTSTTIDTDPLRTSVVVEPNAAIATNTLNPDPDVIGVKNCFILIGKIYDTIIDSLITTKKIIGSYGFQTTPLEINVIGLIRLNKEVGYGIYAILSYDEIPHDKNGFEYTYYINNNQIYNTQTSSYNFNIPNYLFQKDSFYLYYRGYANYSECKLTLFTDNKNYGTTAENTFLKNVTKYTITFKKVNSDIIDVTTIDSKGSSLRFSHYNSIYANSNNTASSAKDNKYVEIQGSKDEYTSPFEEVKDDVKSNTQFFIDQSIVTLNSPDLEFDSELQSYNIDNLELRIVGVIPLTSTASSHRIKASSAMLPTSYNSTSDTNPYSRFGIGERNINVVVKNINISSYKRLVTDYLWEDSKVKVALEDSDTKVTTDSSIYNYGIYPWQRTGSLNTDPRGKEEASSFLQYKRMANIWFSSNSVYLDESKRISYNNTSVQTVLTENAEIINYRLQRQKTTSSDINYYPNIDKVLVNSNGYPIINSNGKMDTANATNPISMKYKSTTHAVIALNADIEKTGDIPILPYGIMENVNIGKLKTSYKGNTFWNDTVSFTQRSLDISSLDIYECGYLLLGELYRKNVVNQFGGKDKYALLNNKWLVAGETVSITKIVDDDNNDTTSVTLRWTEGDTYYQRYDCLKTYPFTEEDTNQIIEMLSFMCETRVNIDGRYDRNRGQLNNTNIRPTNFNLLNPIYSQKNNFFTSRILDSDNRKEFTYPNQVYYSKTKENTSDIDLWTNVTLANTLELDGNKGDLKSLRRFNDALIAFQDSGISQILYNENVQIASTQGVPIEIANSGKVQGKRYISNTIGCSNKWAMCQTPSGIYFIDNNDKSIYLFNGQLTNISTSKGFNSWCKQNIPSSDTEWNPNDYNDFRIFYDKMNQDILFISKNTALAYSEKIGNFTSFYDYSKAQYFENLYDTGIWVKDNKLWRHQAGDYCKFFDDSKPYSMTLIANQEPTLDKIFTNMEFRACVDDEGVTSNDIYTPYLPFDSIETWDEYQHGELELNLRKTKSKRVSATMSRKFRIWRCDIPRDNVKKLDRMRNPWLYIKLSKSSDTLKRTEIHDIMANYFG